MRSKRIARKASKSRTKSLQRGGSNSSKRVEALSPKTCTVFRFPDAIRDVITNRTRQQNLGTAYQIGAGKAPESWFATTFIPALAARIEAGDAPDRLLSYMMRAWNRRATSSSQRLTRAMAMKMLSEFTQANLSAASGKTRVVLPIEWFQPDGLAVQSGGGGEEAAACSPTMSTLGHAYDNYHQYRGSQGDSAGPLGSSIPQNAYQGVQKWFRGETTMFTPTASDPVHHSGVQWRTQSMADRLTAQRVPATFNQTVDVNQMVKGDAPCVTGCNAKANVFRASAPYTSSDVTMPVQRAGGVSAKQSRTRRQRRQQRSRSSVRARA